MLADIGIGPSVKRALLHARHKIGHESVAEPVALLHEGVKVARCRIESERAWIAQAGRERALVRSIGIKALDRRLDLALNPNIAGRSHAHEQGAGLRLDRKVAVGVTLNNPEHALLGDHPLAHDGRGRLALLGRYIGGANVLPAESGTQGTEPMRHLPDAILVGDQYEAITPSQPVGTIEALGMALNPIGLAVAVVVTQQREMAFALLGDDHVTVRQY